MCVCVCVCARARMCIMGVCLWRVERDGRGLQAAQARDGLKKETALWKGKVTVDYR